MTHAASTRTRTRALTFSCYCVRVRVSAQCVWQIAARAHGHGHGHGLFEQTRSRRLVYGTHAVTHAGDNAFSPLARWIFTNNICAPAPLLFTRNPTQPIYSMCDKCRQIIVSRAHKQRQHTNHTRIQKRVGPGRRDCAVLSAV